MEIEENVEEWTEEQYRHLFDRVKENMPKTRKLCYKASLNRINWESVCFPPFSAFECKSRFTRLISHVRKLRTLPIILEETETNLTKICDKISNSDNHLSGYMLFHKKKFPRMREKHPNLSVGELGKMIGSAYRKLNPEIKREFAKKTAKMKIVENDRPKLPPRAWEIFADKKISKAVSKNPEISKEGLRKRYIDKFDDLPLKKKYRYLLKFEDLRQKYETECDEYEKSHQNVKIRRLLMKNLRRERTIIFDYLNVPKRPLNSIFSLFCSQNGSGSISNAAILWKEIPVEDKQKMSDLLLEQKATFRENFERRMGELDEFSNTLVMKYMLGDVRNVNKTDDDAKKSEMLSLLHFFGENKETMKKNNANLTDSELNIRLYDEFKSTKNGSFK